MLTLGAWGWWLSFIALCGAAESDKWGWAFLFLAIFAAISFGSNFVPDQWWADDKGVSLEEYLAKYKKQDEMA